LNLNGNVNILDVVIPVDIIFNNEYNVLADLNNDVSVNVVVVVMFINITLEKFSNNGESQ